MPALLKHPLADCDIEEAALWYGHQDLQVSDRFINSANEAMRKAAHDPYRYSVQFEDYRRVKLKGFPYSVWFTFVGEAVLVTATIHSSRDARAVLRSRRPPSDE